MYHNKIGRELANVFSEYVVGLGPIREYQRFYNTDDVTDPTRRAFLYTNSLAAVMAFLNEYFIWPENCR